MIPAAVHELVESEIWAAWLDGFDAGVADAGRRMDEALEAAFAGPTEYAVTEPGTERGYHGYAEVLRRFKKALYCGGGGS